MKSMKTIFVLVLVILAFASVSFAFDFDFNLAPIAVITASQTNGEIPLVIAFVGIGIDPEGDSVSYHWDFGDGGHSSSQTPVHTYTSPGVYVVRLTVEDEQGNTGTDALTVYAKDMNLPPTVVLTASTTNGKMPLTVAFSAVAVDPNGDRLTYQWDFGDDESSNLQNPIHTYTQIGTYHARVIAEDTAGNTGSDTETIIVTSANGAPSVVMTASSTSGEAPAFVAFTAVAVDPDNDPVTYSWDFGDGETSNLQNPTHTFEEVGTYTVTVTATDNHGNEGQDSMQFVAFDANHAPTVIITAIPTNGEAPLTVVFNAVGVDPDGDTLTYSWDFGNGDTAETQTTVYTFENEGTYNVVVTATDSNGNTGTDSVVITVSDEHDDTNIPPTAIASANPLSGDALLVVSFVGIGIDVDGTIVSYHWNFRDGSTSNQQNPVHTFVNQGIYDVVLTVTDDDGATGSDTVLITVTGDMNVPPVIFPIPDQITCVGDDYAYQIQAADVDNDPLTYRMTTSPSWLSMAANGNITGMALAVGDYLVGVGVSDGEYETTASYVLHVKGKGECAEKEPIGIKISRVRLTRGEYLPVGEMLEGEVSVKSFGKNQKNVRITFGVPELGIFRRAGPFDLDTDDRIMKQIEVEIPEWAQPGDYTIRIDVSNDNIQRVIHREFTVTG